MNELEMHRRFLNELYFMYTNEALRRRILAAKNGDWTNALLIPTTVPVSEWPTTFAPEELDGNPGPLHQATAPSAKRSAPPSGESN
jgi:hypothetical protein